MSKRKNEFFDKIKKDKVKLTAKTLSIENENDIFLPEHHSDDNLLVQIVKEEIIKRKGIILRSLLEAGKFDSSMQMNNFKGGLNKNRKMALERFSEWMDVLDIPWNVLYGKGLLKYRDWRYGINTREDVIKYSYSPIKLKPNDSSAFIPDLEDDDNRFVKIIKKEIIKRNGINLKDLLRSGKFESSMQMNNFKGGLKNNRKMALERFDEWMIILEVKWVIVYGDDLVRYRDWKNK